MASGTSPASPGRGGDSPDLFSSSRALGTMLHAAQDSAVQLARALQDRAAGPRAAVARWSPRDLRWPRIFATADEPSPLASVPLSQRIVEWALIALLVIAYCWPFLDLHTTRVLHGNEAETYQALDWALVTSLARHGQFPFWNPYLLSGLPYVADPFLHLYNPLATLPVLLFGVTAGFKLGLLLSFLAAALGAWWLGVVLGLRGPARVWLALSYAFTGQAAAKFFQGHYDLVLGFAWIPWVVAALLALTATRRPRYAALAALALALLFFSGNGYYAYYMALTAMLYALLVVWVPRPGRRGLRFDGPTAGTLLLAGLLAIGLTAIQLFPMLEFLPHTTKATDPELRGSHTVAQVWQDYTSSDPRRPDAAATLPSEEFYAYLGIAPFFALAVLPFVWRSRGRRYVVVFGLLLFFALLWIDLRDTPLRELYARSSALSQFRYPTRFLLYGALAILVLAALGLDRLWGGLLALRARWAEARPGSPRWLAPWLVLAALGVFLVGSVADVFVHNRSILGTREQYAPSETVAAWLRAHDPTTYYVSAPSAWYKALISRELHYLDAWYGFVFVRDLRDVVNRRPVQARPNYVILGNESPPPHLDAPELLQRFPTQSVYRLPNSLPMAFGVSNDALIRTDAGELRRAEVKPLPLYVDGPNGVEIIAESDGGATLVVLMDRFPGWTVTVDGHDRPLLNVGGYLATTLQPGVHKYVFRYESTPFKLGFVVSLAALLAILVLLGRDLRLTWPHLAPWQAGGSAAWADWAAPGRRRWEALTARWSSRVGARARGLTLSLSGVLFLLALGVYAVTRFVALEQFPIYFFVDEAVLPVFAAELLQRGWRDDRGGLLPLFFQNHDNFQPLLSVYPQALGIALFGESIVVTRAIAAATTVFAAGAVAAILALVFRVRVWWAGVLFLAVAPAWFLHSRTAFETATMASLFAGFLCFYLLYRYRSPYYLFGAVACAAAAVYAYNNGQLVVGVAALLLALSDWSYHRRHWRIVLGALALGVVLAVPYARFRAEHPEEILHHLRTLGSYWLDDLPLHEKLRRFLGGYAYGLSPQYWFVPNEQDLIRHRVKGYGNLPLWTLPFFVGGVIICLARFRSPAHRALLIAALAAPVGGAISGVGITRALSFVIPAVLLMTLGLDWLLARVRGSLAQTAAALAVFAVLSVASIGLLEEALANGEHWYADYGLYGMQYGARQVYGAVSEYLDDPTVTSISVSPTWTNGPDTFPHFFFPGQSRVNTQSVHFALEREQQLDASVLWVLTDAELRAARDSRKFATIQIERTLPYPDGTPGFHFVRLAYVPDVAQRFAAEREARQALVREAVTVGGERWQVGHSQLDAGRVADMFDGNPRTLARVMEANPAVFEIELPSPRPLRGLRLLLAYVNFTLEVSLYGPGDAAPTVYHEAFLEPDGEPDIRLRFDHGPEYVSKVRLQIRDIRAGDTAKIHVRELALE